MNPRLQRWWGNVPRRGLLIVSAEMRMRMREELKSEDGEMKTAEFCPALGDDIIKLAPRVPVWRGL